MHNPVEKNPLRDVIDAAKTKAFRRGAENPGWNDVWLSLAENSAFGKVLAERGVMVSSLARDLEYAAKFGLAGETGEMSAQPGMLARMSAEIEDKITQLLQSYYAPPAVQPEESEWDSALKEAEREINDFIKIELSALIRESQQQTGERNLAKQIILATLLTKLAERAAPGSSPTSLDPLTAHKIQMLLGGPIFSEGDDAAIAVLEQLDGHPLDKPTPLEVIDTVIMASGGLYKQFLYRNGLLTGDAEMKDELAGRFPEPVVQDLALQALELAYQLGSKTVDARHVSAALMAHPELQLHLHDLGVKDLLELREGLSERLFKEENERESAIRVHPQITSAFRAILGTLDGFCKSHAKDEHLPSKLFRKIFSGDQTIDTALNQAGLRRHMSRGWTKPYREQEKDKKDKDQDSGKKRDKPFEVSDQELEALIAEYCVDYTKLAARKKFDPMIGNGAVMEQVETTLLKRGKKNPIVIGEPGVGKTKILEGYAQRIVSGKAPKKLIGSRLLSLDLHSINTSPFVGIFESRILPILKGISERNASGRFPPIQLAIDEFANAMDAGAHSKGEGIKGMIKPYLTSGDLFVIATTTMEEYQTKVQKDGALTRRFNPITMRPPTEEEAAGILAQLKGKYARHHGIRIPNAIIPKIANFAERYIHQVNHPDKSLDLFDLACAMAVKAGDRALEEKHIARATSAMSGVPEEFLNKEDKQRYVALPQNLKGLVLDQDQAIAAVSAALQRAKAGLRGNPEAPVGTFLFVGPTGVGKTELTRALSRLLYGSEEFLIRFDMSEFQEKHSAARFIGAPPGYVGYDEGGGLIKAVQQKPYSVLLYDEIEKAHPDVFNVLLRPFDSGMVSDGRGKSANMRNTINIMTSNLGAAEVMRKGEELGLDPIRDVEKWQEMARPIYEAAVQKFFRPEFLNRLDGVIYFNSLSPETIAKLVGRQVEQTEKQVSENHHGLKLEIADEFRKAAAEKGFDVRYGARPLKRVWQDSVATPLAAWLLAQDDASLKRARKIIVSHEPLKAPDTDAMLEKILAETGANDNLAECIRQMDEELERAAIIVPQFKLSR